MLAAQRRQKILDMLQEEGAVRVSGLSRIFGVSEVTVRKDLEKLSEQDLVARGHGGAFLNGVPEQVRTLSLQHRENMDKKARIGKAAANLIHDEERIILDAGSTTTEIARHIGHKKHLTVITNALNIALMLGSDYGIETMVTGGEFKPPTLSLTGEKAAAFLENVHVDKLFLATAGVSFDAGLTYPGFSDLPVKKAMIDAASAVYLVADSTKIGKKSLATLGGVALIDFLITDEGIEDRVRRDFEKAGVQIVVA